MPECWIRYNLSTDEIAEASFRPIMTGIAVGEAVVSIGVRAQIPDARTQRYNRAGGVRAATSAEIVTYDDAVLRRLIDVELDRKDLKALSVEFLNILRAAGVSGVPTNQAFFDAVRQRRLAMGP